ncbi:DUF1990 domain-containing protein [Actinoplanes sp. NPDC051470]|uniref:DUF1990 family protein n=1 Tax=unclassified Actinoplanes TaxID=2626549 RepID=UPI003434152B
MGHFTYPQVGATRDADLPAGFHHLTRSVPISDFERVAGALMSWSIHRRAFLTISAPPPTPGLTVVMRLAFLTIPCRVVYVVDEPGRRGFAYGTLPGHPESGEELFLVTRTRFEIRAFSRPATRLARAGGPLTRVAQSLATNRYLAAARST